MNLIYSKYEGCDSTQLRTNRMMMNYRLIKQILFLNRYVGPVYATDLNSKYLNLGTPFTFKKTLEDD